MNRSAIDDQNNDNIVDETQDILEEDVDAQCNPLNWFQSEP